MIALYQPLAVTTHYFLQAILVGLCLGILYDILGGVTMVCGRHRFCIYAIDSIFWVIALIVYFVFTVTLAGGQVRGFLIIGMASGVLFCHLAAGWLVRKITCTILELLMYMLGVLIRCTRKVLHFIQAVWQGLQKNLKKICKKTSIFGKKTL